MDEVALGAAQFRFLLAIEVCVDIGRHIIASEGLAAPDEQCLKPVDVDDREGRTFPVIE